jgi:hypothetical protein
MTPGQLETAVARTGAGRLRWLTSDANPDPESRDGYRRYVERVASEPVPEPEPNPHMALLKLVRECPRGGPASCGCNAVRRCSALGRDVAMSECLECAKAGSKPGVGEGA